MKRLSIIVLIAIILSCNWLSTLYAEGGIEGDRPSGLPLHVHDSKINEENIDARVTGEDTEETTDEADQLERLSQDVAAGLNLTQGSLHFNPRTYKLGGFPRATSVVDIDSDGDLDILVTNPDNQYIVLLLNNGDGTFETGNSLPVEGYPISVISTDMDGDSDTDLVILDSEGYVRTFLNKGDMTFSPGNAYPVEIYSFSISPSDVDSDNDTDIIVMSERIATIFLNDGKGGLDATLSYQTGINSPTTITADLNYDNKDDMIIGDAGGISILLNNGDGTFANGIAYTTGEMPISIAAGDMDSNLIDELIVANYMGNTISILKNNGLGEFQKMADYPSGEGPNSVTLEDIDGDEDLDIIVTNGPSGDLSIFINDTVRPLTITTKSLPHGQRGIYYSTRLEATGGVPPYRWEVVSGSLPPSLSLDPLTGELFSISESEHGSEIASHPPGEPLLSMSPLCFCLKAPVGLYRFTVQATDSSSNTATANPYIEVLPTPGKVSGKVSYSGEKRGIIRIGLWPRSQSLLMDLFVTPIYSSILRTSGEYKIDNIYPESYLVGAFLDVNGDGKRQKGDEPFGRYRPNGPGEKPEAIVVDDGSDLSGIDIDLVDTNREQHAVDK